MARQAPPHRENRQISGVDRDGLTERSFKSLCGAKPCSTGVLLRKLILQVAFGNRRWRVAALARPAEERKAAAVGAWDGDDQVVCAEAFDAADATSVKVEFDRGAEAGAAAADASHGPL
jgi:hypothetical protein